MLIWALEDDEDLRGLILTIGRMRGHHVVAFSNLEEAWSAFRGAAQEPQMVICDLMLEGKRSDSWMLAVRERFPQTPIVCFSGSLDAGILDTLEQHGIHAVAKPASLLTLFKLLEKN